MKERLFNVLAWAGFLALCVGVTPAVLIYSFAGFQEWNHERVGPDFFTETCDYWVKNPPTTSIVIPRHLTGSGEAETHYYDTEEFDQEACSYSAWGTATYWMTKQDTGGYFYDNPDIWEMQRRVGASLSYQRLPIPFGDEGVTAVTFLALAWPLILLINYLLSGSPRILPWRKVEQDDEEQPE